MEPVSDNSNIINSILRITFAILSLALIAEFTYIFYIVPNKKVATTIAPTILLTLTPTPTTIVNSTKKTPTPSIPPMKEFKGKIVNIMINNIEVLSDGYKPGLLLSLVDETDRHKASNRLNFAFKKEELNKIKVIDQTGKTISYTDLKIDQNIRMVEISNLEDKINTSYVITVMD